MGGSFKGAADGNMQITGCTTLSLLFSQKTRSLSDQRYHPVHSRKKGCTLHFSNFSLQVKKVIYFWCLLKFHKDFFKDASDDYL